MLILGQAIDWIRYNTLGVTEALRQLLYLAQGFNLLMWTDAQLALVLSASSAILSLIAAKTNVSAPKVEDRMVEAKATSFAKGQAEAQRMGGEPTP